MLLAFAAVAAETPDAPTSGKRTLAEYRYFRALSIDLQGRPPTRDELAQLERPDFSLDRWLDDRLDGPGYAERMRRIYMDLLRLELPPTVKFEPPSLMLHRGRIAGPDGALIDVYFRYGQRRANADLDGQFCFTEDESGVKVPVAGSQLGVPRPVTAKLLAERTVLVKPWWLYADYRAADPQDRVAADWAVRHPGYEVMSNLFVDADGKTPTTAIRVCKEEAQTATTGHVFTTGRVVRKSDPLPKGRLTRLPVDTAFAKANAGRVIACTSQAAFQSTIECGCGVGLERCLPNTPNAFMLPVYAPIGVDQPFFASPRPAAAWLQSWWSEEAGRYLEMVFGEDRDVRELLTGRGTIINGPLAQFYRWFAGATCCGPATDLGYVDPEPLFEPAAVPIDLVPTDAARWEKVADRGPHAAGLMTMPIFLVKYGSRRARAHALYNAFSCKDFVASTARLIPSSEPDLMKRPGCSECHVKLEPLAAYFTRVQESDWTYLPGNLFPVAPSRCPGNAALCKTYYDPAFTDDHHTLLRGAIGSEHNAEAGPRELAEQLANGPDFAPCVVQNIAQSLLGRPLTAADDAWKAHLAKQLVDDGFHVRAVVRAILTSPEYHERSERGAP
jgi:hypothetical protein